MHESVGQHVTASFESFNYERPIEVYGYINKKNWR